MNTLNFNKFSRQIIVLTVITLASTALAQAQAQRTFVSADPGVTDNTSCGRTQPCHTFTAALTAVASGGEVIVLTSGSYGAMTITKAVQLVAPTGVHAAITQSSGNAITVAAGASDVVVVRGLILNGPASSGINFDTGAALHVENCVIDGFNRGINFDASGELFVKDTIVRNGFVGILISSSSGTTQASIDRSRIENNKGTGVVVSNNARVSVSDSVAAGNGFHGFVVADGKMTISHSTAANNGASGFAVESGVVAVMAVESCVATGNANSGMLASGGSDTLMRVSNSVATDNEAGFGQVGGATFESYGNNRVRGNTSDTSGLIIQVREV